MNRQMNSKNFKKKTEIDANAYRNLVYVACRRSMEKQMIHT